MPGEVCGGWNQMDRVPLPFMTLNTFMGFLLEVKVIPASRIKPQPGGMDVASAWAY
jgi:hypothetical protein